MDLILFKLHNQINKISEDFPEEEAIAPRYPKLAYKINDMHSKIHTLTYLSMRGLNR